MVTHSSFSWKGMVTMKEKGSQLERARREIQHAIDDGISLYEMTGTYNPKYAKDTIRKVAIEFWKRDLTKEAISRRIFIKPKYSQVYMDTLDYRYKDYVRAKEVTIDGHKRIYCKVDRDAPHKVMDEIEEQIRKDIKELEVSREAWER